MKLEQRQRPDAPVGGGSDDGSLAPRLGPAQVLVELVQMGKPRLSSLVLFTVMAGMLLAWVTLGRGPVSGMPPALVLHTLCGVMLAAFGCAALNQLIEEDSDRHMERTRDRALPSGRVGHNAVVAWGLGCSLAGTLQVALLADPLAGVLTGLTVLLYVSVYTPLKRRSSYNTLVGAVTGATPPVIGWLAVEGSLSLGALVLFALLYVWQIPHFLAIALFYREDYGRAGLRMLSLEDLDGDLAARQALLFLLALVPVGMLPFLCGIAGLAYAATALGAGLVFLGFGIYLWRAKTRVAARRLFLVSILYLPIVLGVLVLDAFLLRG